MTNKFILNFIIRERSTFETEEIKQMKILRNNLIALALMLGVVAIPNFAQTYRVNDRQVRTLLTRIEQRTNNFKSQLDRSLDRSSLNNTKSEDYINEIVANFENSADRMKSNFSNGNNINNDVNEVLSNARYIETVMRDYRFESSTQSTWNLLRTDLSQLARYYNVAWNWNSTNNNFPATSGLSGTYRLNVQQSDDLETIINRSLSNVSYNQREKMKTNLQRRLAVPEALAIERNNNMIALASSNAGKTSFEATGRATSERLSNGRTVYTTASLSGDRLVVNSDGDKVNAYYLAFEPYNNGQKLKVTRRLNLENRNQTITVVSVYDKTSTTAQWNIYNNNNSNDNNQNNANFYVPSGTRMTAVLNSNLSTKDAFEGQKFSMVVNQPAAYNGAVIEGTVDKVERSGRLTGNAKMNLNFETIRLRNGSTYRFEGLIDQITAQNGKTIQIDNEGEVQGSSQTNDTVVRGGVGAAIGAIIGGLTGGGKGAVIGAVIGGGAGTGSVLIQGRDNIELNSGTTFAITSSSPNRVSLR